MMRRILLWLFLSAMAYCAWCAPLRFAVLSDTHVAPDSPADAALRQAIDEINGGDFAFVLALGDLGTRGTDAELEHLKRVFDTLNVPVHVIPGNHETNWSESAATRFPALWGSERFAFEADGVFFIGLSTGPYLRMGDGFVRSEDLNWLKDTLAAEVKPGEPVVFAAHYPLCEGLSNWPEVIEILRPYRVELALCGHWHQMRRAVMNGIPAVICRALEMDSGVPGYTIIERDGDGRYRVWDKPVGGAALPVSDDNCEVIDNPAIPLGDPKQVAAAEIRLMTADPSSVFTGVTTWDGNFYYGTSSGELKIGLCATGEIVDAIPDLGPLYATPVVAAAGAAVGTVREGLQGFSPAGIWRWTLPAAAPMINDGLADGGDLLTGLGARDFVRVNLADGVVKWCWSGANGIFQGRPACGEGVVVFGAWDRYLYCLDAATGKERWRWTNDKSNVLFSPGNVVPVIARGRVFIVAPDRYMTAIDLGTGRTVWRNRQYKYRESLGGSADGSRVYAKTMDGELVAVDTGSTEFRTLWVANLGFGYEHNPCPELEAAGVVYCGSRTGAVAAVDAATGRGLYSIKLGNSAVNQFHAAADGSVWLSLIEGKIYRITPR